MRTLRRLIGRLVARVDRIADRDADPTALIGRSGRRRGDLPTASEDPVRREHAGERSAERTPEEARQALDEIRADQHRRMRGRWRPDRAGD